MSEQGGGNFEDPQYLISMARAINLLIEDDARKLSITPEFVKATLDRVILTEKEIADALAYANGERFEYDPKYRSESAYINSIGQRLADTIDYLDLQDVKL